MRDYQKETIETYNKQAAAFQKTRADFLNLERITEFTGMLGGNHILDLGCGPGRDAAEFVNRGYEVTGIDITENFIALASEAVPEANFFVMDMLELVFQENMFDGVWASASLLHLKREDIPQAMSEVFRVLKPGGVFRFTLKKGVAERTEEDFRLDNGKRFFSFLQRDEVEHFIKETGFEILRIYESTSYKGPKPLEWIDAFVKKPL